MINGEAGKINILDASLRKLKAEREEKVVNLMDRLGLDVLVGLSGGDRGQRGTVRFLANYSTTSQSSCVLWAREGAPRLLVPYSVFRYDAEAMSWVQDIQVDPDYPVAIARYLKEQKCTRGKLGWVGPPLLVQSVRSGLETLPLQVSQVSVQAAFSEMSATKTPEELKLVRRCAEIADEVLRKVAEKVRPGVTDREIVAEAEYTARCLGTEGGSMTISKSTAIAGPVLTDEPLGPCDVFQFSVEPAGPGGFWVQTVRMFALGEPPKEVTQLIEKGLEAEREAASLLREGCRTADVARAMLTVMRQRESSLAVQLGHGIGLVMAEPPRINANSADTLKANMTIVIHPSERGERFAMFLGDTFLTGKNGAERLSEFPSDLVVI
jgi:Xaa-Pro aminopeptidase